MSVDGELPALATKAVLAAQALARDTRPTQTRLRWTLEDHATGLQKFDNAVRALTDSGALLDSLLGSVHCQREGRAHPRLHTPRSYLTSLDKLDQTARATAAAVRLADINPAFRRVVADSECLPETSSSHGYPSGLRNLLAIRARQVGAAVANINDDIWPPDGLVSDIAVGLQAVIVVVRAYATTCAHEAILLDHAYTAARIPREAARAGGIITAAREALITAHQPLLASVRRARTLANREATLPPISSRRPSAR